MYFTIVFGLSLWECCLYFSGGVRSLLYWGGLLFLVATGYGWGRGWLESGLHGVSTLSYAGALVQMGFVFQF